MLTEVCLLLIINLNYFNSFSRAEYQYLEIKNVNRVEPPSLESEEIVLDGDYEEPTHGVQAKEYQLHKPHRQSITHISQGNNAILAEASSQTGGWKVVSRKLAEKKCAVKPKTRAILPPQTRVLAEAPRVRMVDRKKEESALKIVSRVHLTPENIGQDEKILKPNVREKIETYTETYVVTTLKTRVRTRKRLFVQQRKIVNQRVNKPVVVVRRKMIKEKQVFERVIPKIIETRQVINHPLVQSQIVEGPVVEVTEAPKPNVGVMTSQNPLTTQCPVVDIVDDPAGETVDGDTDVIGMRSGFSYLGKK